MRRFRVRVYGLWLATILGSVLIVLLPVGKAHRRATVHGRWLAIRQPEPDSVRRSLEGQGDPAEVLAALRYLREFGQRDSRDERRGAAPAVRRALDSGEARGDPDLRRALLVNLHGTNDPAFAEIAGEHLERDPDERTRAEAALVFLSIPPDPRWIQLLERYVDPAPGGSGNGRVARAVLRAIESQERRMAEQELAPE